jgi:isopentenyl phosphate kinase
MIKMKNLMILKIGGSLITKKHKEKPAINKENLKRMVKEVKDGFDFRNNSLILIHGAGSYGHPIVKRTGIHKGIENKEQLIAFAETQRLQNELNVLICEELIKQGLAAIPVQASSSAVMDKGRLISMDFEAIKGFLEVGLVPVLYGVPAYDKSKKCSILSGDQIITYLAKNLGAKKMIHVTDVEGVFTGDPKKNHSAKLIREITKENFKKMINYIGGSAHTDVTGGMFGKVKELLEVEGIPSEIISDKNGNIKRVLKGEEGLGTVIKS